MSPPALASVGLGEEEATKQGLKFEAKVSPTREHEDVVRFSILGSFYGSEVKRVIIGYSRMAELWNQSTIVLSQSLINELSRDLEPIEGSPSIIATTLSDSVNVKPIDAFFQ